MIDLQNVRKVYRAGLVETEALSDLSVKVAAGEFVAVMGPSGSGKTTFLNVAGLLDTFDSGTFLLEGEDASHLSDRRRTRLRNEKIGFIFQSFNLIPDLDVFDNVEVPLRYRGLPARERAERVEKILVEMGLVARMRHLPSQLSGGQQQRVAIARALVGQPRLLLADEPTGNLDSVSARRILELLEQINVEAGTTIVMVTHDHAIASRAHRKLHILDGRVIDPQRPPPLASPTSSSLVLPTLMREPEPSS
ncbi:MAG: ABC transporter ATP-binding protein [Myxococcales bacterium]|nr:ABC transporter ATP-binding protein [Myxococcales bacterium]